MPGMWVKRLGRTHNCLDENRDVLTKQIAEQHDEGSMWMCSCGKFWIVVDEGDGIHRWLQHRHGFEADMVADGLVEDADWRYR